MLVRRLRDWVFVVNTFPNKWVWAVKAEEMRRCLQSIGYDVTIQPGGGREMEKATIVEF